MTWKTTSLGLIADVNWGDTSVTKSSYVSNGYPAYSATGNDGLLPYADYDRDGIVLSAIGARCGKTWYVSGKWSCIKNTIRFWSTSPDVDNRFLYWLTSRSSFWPRRGAAQPFITIGDAREVSVKIPPLNQQRRIAAILDAADALRAKRRAALAKLDALAQSIFSEMFGHQRSDKKPWQVKRLGDIAEFFSGNTLPLGVPFQDQSDGFLLLKVSDLNIPTNAREVTVSAEWSDKSGSKAGTCPANAVVFPKRGGAIGTNKKRILKRDGVLDPNLMGVVPHNETIHIEYLYGWFNTFDLTDISSGSSVPQLNKQDLAPLFLPVPPYEQQLKFSIFIENLNKHKVAVNQALQKIEELCSNLQFRAFRGEL